MEAADFVTAQNDGVSTGVTLKKKAQRTPGLDHPMYGFGTLVFPLTEKEQLSIFKLVLHEAMPFGSFWCPKIAKYLGMKQAQVYALHRQAEELMVEGKEIKRTFKAVPKIQEQISSFMARIIKKWRDDKGKPYTLDEALCINKLKSMANEYLIFNANKFPGDDQIQKWCKKYRLDTYKCYAVVKEVHMTLSL